MDPPDFLFEDKTYIEYATLDVTKNISLETFRDFVVNDRQWVVRAETFGRDPYYKEVYTGFGRKNDSSYEGFCYEIRVVVFSFRYRLDLLAELFKIPKLPLRYAIHYISEQLIEQDAVQILKLYEKKGYELADFSSLKPTTDRSRDIRGNGAVTARCLAMNNAYHMAKYYLEKHIILGDTLHNEAYNEMNVRLLSLPHDGCDPQKKEEHMNKFPLLVERMLPDEGPEKDPNYVHLYYDLAYCFPVFERENRQMFMEIAARNGNVELLTYLEKSTRENLLHHPSHSIS